jgi:hypothetical protein
LKKSVKAKGKKKAGYVDISDDDGPPVEQDVEEDDDHEGAEKGDDVVEDGDVAVEEEVPRALKIGPPAGKKNIAPPPTQALSPVAGPSSQPVAAKGQKPKTSKRGKLIDPKAGEEINIASDAKNPPKDLKTKKRPAEEELVSQSPTKIQKMETLRKSARVGTKPSFDETEKVSCAIWII